MANPSTTLQLAFIRLNNGLTRWRRVRVASDRLLLLVAHCLQGSACGQNLTRGADECKGCGQCPIADIRELRHRYGIRCVVAAGGRQAVAAVREPVVAAVVAVACEKELAEGIRAAFPKPVLAVSNTRPNGPCRDTRVGKAAVEAAIRAFLGGPETDAPEAAGKPAR